MKKKFRIEKDSIGNKKIENSCLWGAQTQRSLENFDIGEEKIPNEIITAIGYQKKAAALTNIELGKLEGKIGKAIIAACDQIINSNLNNQFPLSVWQTGSGTQTNMNANEVISNYAIKKLKGKIGSKIPVHPNDHVNLSQSSNDTFPTVMHIASNQIIETKLINSLKRIKKILSDKTKIYKDIIKIGRTHTQDATPITLGQEFSGYTQQIINNLKRLKLAKKELLYIPQGGTAVGTGINAPKNFDKFFCKSLSNITKADVTKFIKKAPKATLLRTATTAGAGGIAGIVGPAALLLTVIGTQMKKDSALSNFLNKSKEKDLPKAMSPGPKKKKKLSGISGKQKKENEKRANIREGQRGKVGPKRNVIKTSTGILRDKSGKAVKRLSREEVLKRRKANR